jgi:hypothetical protein
MWVGAEGGRLCSALLVCLLSYERVQGLCAQRLAVCLQAVRSQQGRRHAGAACLTQLRTLSAPHATTTTYGGMTVAPVGLGAASEARPTSAAAVGMPASGAAAARAPARPSCGRRCMLAALPDV